MRHVALPPVRLGSRDVLQALAGMALLTSLLASAAPSIAVGQTPTPTQTFTPTPTTTPVPTFAPDTCFAVPASTNNLVTINAVTGAEAIVGPTGSGSTIRGLAIPPVGSTLYAATATQLGTVNPSTGAFAAIGAFGTGINGALGPITFDNLVALSYDSGDGVLYGVHRTTLPPSTCYAVETTGNTLVTINSTTGNDTAVGATANGVEAVALVGSTLYAAAGDQLGVIQRSTGVFTPRSANFGQGDPGPIDFDDVRGLSFDVVNRILYATSRRPGSDDVLFIANLVTGARVPLQFNAGSDDYVPISGGSCPGPVDIDAIAMDLVASTLFASNGTDLVTIDRTTGACNVVGPFGGAGPAVTITGLGFDNDGNLFGTNADTFYSIDTTTGEATSIGGGLTVGSNYAALDCPIALPDVLFRIDPASGSYVPLHFDFEFDDYATIEGGGCGTEIEALAYDQFHDTLLAVDSTDDVLIDIDKVDGFCAIAFAEPLTQTDIVSMSYSGSRNTLFGAGQSNFYSIDRDTGIVTTVAPLTAGTNYQALECPTPGCRLTVRKRHIGVPYSGSDLNYRLFWLNPCRGMTFSNVVLTDVLPPGLELISATSNAASIQSTNNTLTLVDAFLPKGPAEFATLRARITAPPGARLVNTLTLRDNFGREFSSSDTIRVREARSAASLTLHSNSKTAPGKHLTYTGRYRGIAPGNTLVLTLPAGLEARTFFPEPTSTDGNTITWSNLPSPSGGIRVRARVAESVADAAILTASATLSDTSGNQTTDTQDAVVTHIAPPPTPVPAAASVEIAAAKQVRSGLVTTFSVRYRNVQGAATLSVTLPPEMLTDQTIPTALVSGSTLTWPGLTSATGSVKVKALVSSAVAAGALLRVDATIADDQGSSATTAEILVRN